MHHGGIGFFASKISDRDEKAQAIWNLRDPRIKGVHALYHGPFHIIVEFDTDKEKDFQQELEDLRQTIEKKVSVEFVDYWMIYKSYPLEQTE